VRYGFLDESGDVAYTAEAGNTLVVAVVVANHPDALRKAVTKTRKALGKRARHLPELKAADSDPRLVRKLLTHAVGMGFEAVGVILDKRQILEPEDPEELYRETCAVAIREIVQRWGSVSVILDRRYTKRQLREKLERVLEDGVESLGHTMVLRHEDSTRERALQVADAVAWALFQKYERQDASFWEIIRENVVTISRP
jgi:hypothetical protein